MQKGDFNSAQTSNNNALAEATGNYFLESNYADAFNGDVNTTEDIFSMQVTTVDGINSMQLFYGPQAFGGRGDSSYGSREQGKAAAEFYTTVKTAYISAGEPQ